MTTTQKLVGVTPLLLRIKSMIRDEREYKKEFKRHTAGWNSCMGAIGALQ